MWSHFCVRTAALAGGRPQGGITIRTRWVTWPEHIENDARTRSGLAHTARRARRAQRGPPQRRQVSLTLRGRKPLAWPGRS